MFIQLENLSKRFGQDLVLPSTSLTVERGELVTLLGPSGCGKTTLLRLIAGFLEPDSGTVRIGGKDVTNLPANKRDIGMVFQSYALFPNMTVLDNVAFGLRMRKIAKRERVRRAEEMIAWVGLQGKESHYPRELSGGQQQRVALARALVIEPQVLLLDEPLSALDAKIRISLRTLIRELQRRVGITTIFVTHDQEEALSLSDRVFVMQQGAIVQAGTPHELYHYPKTEFVARFIGTYNFFELKDIDPIRNKVRFADEEIEVGHIPEGATRQYKLAVRPEALRVCTSEGAPDGVPNLLLGQIRRLTLLGSVTRLVVDVNGQTVLADVLSQPEHRWEEGQQVAVQIPPESCLFVAP